MKTNLRTTSQSAKGFGLINPQDVDLQKMAVFEGMNGRDIRSVRYRRPSLLAELI